MNHICIHIMDFEPSEALPVEEPPGGEQARWHRHGSGRRRGAERLDAAAIAQRPIEVRVGVPLVPLGRCAAHEQKVLAGVPR